MAQAALKEGPARTEEVFTTDMSVGEILRRSRQYYRLSLMDIERELHIKPPQIEAMESDRFDHLPGKVYAIGFIRSYSEHLGLDGDKMVKLYKQQARSKPIEPELQFPACSSESKLPSVWLVAVCIIALVGVSLAWAAYQKSLTLPSSQLEQTIPPVPEDIRQTTQIKATMMEPAAPPSPQSEPPAAQAPVSTPPKGIILKVKQNSWVEIKGENGNTLVSRVLNEGEQYMIPDRPGLSLSVGNAAGIELSIEDKTLPPLGEDGQVVRDFALNFDYLKSKYIEPTQTTP